MKMTIAKSCQEEQVTDNKGKTKENSKVPLDWFLLLPYTDCLKKLKIMSEVVLLLPNTDCLQQIEDYVRGCTTSTKY